MKLILCITALFSSLFMGGDKYEYKGPNNEYSVMISKNSKVQSTPRDDGGYQDFMFMYDGGDTNTPAYLITVVKVPGVTFAEKDLYDTAFTGSFQANCGCTVTGTSTGEYKNIKGLQVALKMNKEDGVWVGYSINIVHSGALYSIDFLTSEQNFEKYKGEFKDAMNSMKLN